MSTHPPDPSGTPRRRRSRVTAAGRAALLASVMALVAGACAGNGLDDAAKAGGDSPSSASTKAGADRPERPPLDDTVNGWRPDGPLAWARCEVETGYQCATLTVPLDWDAVDGATIDLALIRRVGSGEVRGSLVTNPGGPGGSGIDFLRSGPFDDVLGQGFDLVSWDPRGVGASTAFDCGGHVDEFLANDPDPDDPAEQAAIDADAEQVADDCGASDPGLSAHVNTDDNARDLEAIRIAVADPKLSYIGFSYGTLIGLRYLDLFPTHVRAIVLDGVVDPTLDFDDWLRGQTAAIDQSLDRAFASCDRRTDCPVDDAAAAFDRLKRQVETDPIPGDRASVGPAELATAAVYVSYEPSLWPDLADALAAGIDGDGQPLLDLAQGYYDFGGFTAYAAVECLDSVHPTGPDEYRAFADELRTISPRFGGSTANELLPCAYWPTPPRPITGAVSGTGSPPVLVLGNRGDAATPYSSSVKVADMLDDGHLVSYDGEGHTSYGRSTCVNDVVHDYLLDLRVPDSDPDCR